MLVVMIQGDITGSRGTCSQDNLRITVPVVQPQLYSIKYSFRKVGREELPIMVDSRIVVHESASDLGRFRHASTADLPIAWEQKKWENNI